MTSVSDVSPLPAPDGGADGPVAYAAATAAATPQERADRVSVVTSAAAGRVSTPTAR